MLIANKQEPPNRDVVELSLAAALDLLSYLKGHGSFVGECSPSCGVRTLIQELAKHGYIVEDEGR